MKNTFLAILTVVMLCGGCSPYRTTSGDEIPVIDVRSAIQHESYFSMKDDVKSIEYIPLETTDECLISNIIDLKGDDNYLFIHNGKTNETLAFNRQGKFIRKIGQAGQGPGEYAPSSISSISLDAEKKEIYLNRGTAPALIFSYQGDYLRKDTTASKGIGQRHSLKNGVWALAGTHFTPKQNSPWLLALQDNHNQLIETKSVFPASIPDNVAYMKEIQLTPFEKSAIAFTPCCDTLFRATPSGIEPAYIYDRKNGEEYYNLIADIRDLQLNKAENSSTIELFSFFETSNYIYFRAIKKSNPDKIYFQRLDKKSGVFLSQSIPQDFIDVSRGFSDGCVVGLKNDIDNGAPICPNFVYKDKACMQIINATTLQKLRDKGYLKNSPKVLNVDELDNPIVILYHFK